MSRDAWGDEGNVCPCGGNHFDEGFVEGWERALERAAQTVEGYVGTDGRDATVSVRALAMTFRALKARAREGAAS